MKKNLTAEDFLFSDSALPAPSDDHQVTAEAILALAQTGKLRDSNDLKDFSAEMMGALLRKEVTVGASREMRQWAELIYSLIQTESMSNSGKEINFIGQLVQMSGVNLEEKPMIEVEPQKQLPEPELGVEDLFTEIVEHKIATNE
tara:strand:+ start:783 stop:1217 length:435 start_codon:yes stop_codon:yes gene_type:complete